MSNIETIEEFISKIPLSDNARFTKFIRDHIGDIKSKAISCKENGIDLIHMIFSRCTDLDLIEDVFIQVKYSFQLYKNIDQQNWLHCAAKSNSNEKVIKLLLDYKKFEVSSTDGFNYTPIHYAFLNEHLREKYSDELLKYLVKSVELLLKEADDGISPIQLICDNTYLMDKMINLFKAKFINLLIKIDDVKSGIVITEFDDKYYRTTRDFWTLILLTNDKYRLMRYMKKLDYTTIMYINEVDMKNYMKRTSENGLGILTFVRENFKVKDSNFSAQLFYNIIHAKPRLMNMTEFRFFHSSVFLCLITGRLDLVPALIQYTQFDIVPFSMITCLICDCFLKQTFVSEPVCRAIKKCKLFCEEYAISVINRVSVQDLSKQKAVTFKYLTKKSERFEMKNILEIAQTANCQKFLSLPICQEAIDLKWRKSHKSCRKRFGSPFAKYLMNTFAFVFFLLLFSVIILSTIGHDMSYLEMAIYTYGFAYGLEEMKQIVVYVRKGLFRMYITDASNIMDLLAVINLTISFCFRIYDFVFTEHTDWLGTKNPFIVRCFLSISFIFFFMRLLYFASIIQTFGPKLRMITEMIIKDLVPLIFIFTIFIIPFGVVSHSMLYQNVRIFSSNVSLSVNHSRILPIIGDIFRRAAFTIFDVQYTLEEIEVLPSDKLRDPESKTVSYILLLIYMVIVNVMLMNLLIALFSNTVTEIIERARESWKASRYGFVREYMAKSFLPPPLNIFIILYQALFKTKCTSKCHRSNTNSSSPININNEAFMENRNLLKRQMSSKIEENYNEFMSYYIIQAFALKNNRYDLLDSAEDRIHELKVYLQKLDNKIDQKFRYVSDEMKKLRNSNTDK